MYGTDATNPGPVRTKVLYLDPLSIILWQPKYNTLVCISRACIELFPYMENV